MCLYKHKVTMVTWLPVASYNTALAIMVVEVQIFLRKMLGWLY